MGRGKEVAIVLVAAVFVFEKRMLMALDADVVVAASPERRIEFLVQATGSAHDNLIKARLRRSMPGIVLSRLV